MTVSFLTFGCTVNSAETQEMRQSFLENGDEVIEQGSADAIIVNSCAVTAAAEGNSLQALKRLRRKNPHAVIALVGCYGESLLKKGRRSAPDADIVLGNEKSSIAALVHAALASTAGKGGDAAAKSEPPALRAFLPIQNGCDNRCSYCVVPSLRGAPSSTPMPEVRAQLQTFASNGVREIVVAGINLALYRDDGNTLIDVLKEADKMEGLERIRLSSLEPPLFTDAFINSLPEITRLCPHLHISLQSGDDQTLSAMDRRYTFEEYLSILTKVRAALPAVSVTTDVIAGFPGESDAAFLNSCRNIAQCAFSDIHIFKYSKRDGTVAAGMCGQVTEHKKALRATLLHGIKMQARYDFLRGFVGSKERIMVTRREENGSIEGVTPHNARVLVGPCAPAADGFLNVEITGVSEHGEALTGRVVEVV